MILFDVLDLVNKEKRNKERIRAVQEFAVALGIVAAIGLVSGLLLTPRSKKGMGRKRITL